MINDLKELVAIDSTLSDASDNAPFGNGARAALDLFLERASAYGLKTGDDGGYCGWAEYGEGRMVGVLAHLDIVPAGSGWKSDPFTLTEKSGNLYGRGVCDDKGAAIAALHAIKSLAEDKVKLNGRVRLIAGCNEESGCGCMKHYVRTQELPEISFTPDAEFPVINSEKGILHLLISFAQENILRDNFEYIRGGERANVVPASAECKITGNLRVGFPQSGVIARMAANNCKAKDYTVSRSDGIIIGAKGRAAHGSTPEKGDNAVRKLFSLLAAVIPDSPAVRFISDCLAADNAAERLGIYAEDEKTGKLTFNLGIAELDGGTLRATVDMRLPLAASADDIISRIRSVLPAGATVETLVCEPNLYVDEDDALVQTLLGVYEKHFGKSGKPLQIGGGTYAKTLPRCVAFGPAPLGEDYHMHDADEYLPKDLFLKLKDIYRDAIIELDKLLAKN